MTRNQLTYWQNQETKRNNQVVERETERHDRATEKLQHMNYTNTYNLGLGNLAESQRSNQAREVETNRSNLAQELLKQQANYISQHQADTARMNAYTNIGNLHELQRSNLAQEQLKSEYQAEIVRKNNADISNNNLKAITQASELDNSRNRWQEELAEKYNELAELSRHNTVTEQENERKNKLDQEIRALELKHKIEIDNSSELRNWLNSMNQAIAGRSGYGGLLSPKISPK